MRCCCNSWRRATTTRGRSHQSYRSVLLACVVDKDFDRRVPLSAKLLHRTLWKSVGCEASLTLDTLARILFPQCPAIWRAKSCRFSGTNHIILNLARQDGRKGGTQFAPCCAIAMPFCHACYELFTKCVTPTVTHVHLTISS